MSERRSTAIVRYFSALALLSVGIDHIYEYYADDYRAIPTIGMLFLLNFISALVVALVPLRHFAGRFSGRLVTLLALSGIGIAGGTLAGLLISERSPLFGFREFGYREAIVLSIVFDVATVVLLAAFVFLRTRPGPGGGAQIRPRAPASHRGSVMTERGAWRHLGHLGPERCPTTTQTVTSSRKAAQVRTGAGACAVARTVTVPE